MQRINLSVLILGVTSAFGYSFQASAATTTEPLTPPAKVYDNCQEASPMTGYGIAAAQTFQSSITYCMLPEIKKHLIALKGQQDGEGIAQQLEALFLPIVNFYSQINESNRYCFICGNMGAEQNIIDLNEFLTGFLSELTQSSETLDYSDRYKETVTISAQKAEHCQKQSKTSPQECMIRLIRKQINIGFRDERISEGQQQFDDIYSRLTKLYNSLYPHNQQKSDAATMTQLQVILARLIFLNTEKEGY